MDDARRSRKDVARLRRPAQALTAPADEPANGPGAATQEKRHPEPVIDDPGPQVEADHDGQGEAEQVAHRIARPGRELRADCRPQNRIPGGGFQ
jgi:hypothetical protein